MGNYILFEKEKGEVFILDELPCYIADEEIIELPIVGELLRVSAFMVKFPLIFPDDKRRYHYYNIQKVNSSMYYKVWGIVPEFEKKVLESKPEEPRFVYYRDKRYFYDPSKKQLIDDRGNIIRPVMVEAIRVGDDFVPKELVMEYLD